MGIMFCPKCGNKIIEDGAKFCPECGNQLVNNQRNIQQNVQQNSSRKQSKLINKQKIGLVVGIIVIAVVLFSALGSCRSGKQSTSENYEAEAIKIDKKIKNYKGGNPGVQFENTYLEVGKVTLQDLLDLGAVMRSSTTINEPTYLMDPNKSENIFLAYGETRWDVSVLNESDQMQPVSKAIVYGFSVDKGTSVIAPGGVTIGDSIEKLKSVLGEPLKVDYADKKIYYRYGTKQGSPAMSFEATRNKPDVIDQFYVYMPNLLIKSKKDVDDTIIQTMMAKRSDDIGTTTLNVKTDSILHSTVQTRIDVVGGPNWDKLLICKVKDGVEFSDDEDSLGICSSLVIATYSLDVNISEENRESAKRNFDVELEDMDKVYGAIVYGDLEYYPKDKELMGQHPDTPKYATFASMDLVLENYLTGEEQGYPEKRSLDDYEISTISLKDYNK